MALRFHRSLRILPGVHLNIAKTGVSLSIGGSPLTINIGRRRERITGSLPGTGLSYSKDLESSSRGGPGFWLWRWIRAMFD